MPAIPPTFVTTEADISDCEKQLIAFPYFKLPTVPPIVIPETELSSILPVDILFKIFTYSKLLEKPSTYPQIPPR